MHPNDPSDGPETGAGAEHGDAEHGRTGSGAPNQTSAEQADEAQARSFENSLFDDRAADDVGTAEQVTPDAPEASEAPGSDAVAASAFTETPDPAEASGAQSPAAPRLSPPEGSEPGWATGPNNTDRASYVFPGPDEGRPGAAPGAPQNFPGSAPEAGQNGPRPGAFGSPHGHSAHQGHPGQQGSHTAAFASVGHGDGSGAFGGPQGPGGFNGPRPGDPHQGGLPPFGPPGQSHYNQFGQGPYPGHPQEPRKKRGTGRIVGIAAATALVTSLIVGPAAALGTAYLMPGGVSSPISSLTGEQGSSATEGAVGEVAEQVLPSVVSIQTGSGGGSGVIISSDGQILTNSHVVEAGGGGPIQVRFNDGSAAEAEVLGSDPVSDIAVIQAKDRNDLTPATLGDSDQVGVGGEVVAIGSPLGLSGTVTTGVVSALNRPVNTGATESGDGQTATVINAIQTDAAINPGNSGGPLVNMAGEVIGVNTAIAGLSQESGSVGLGFAIPINQVQPIAEQLIEGGSASYPAIQATIAPSRTGGAEIMELTEGGAADEAGLEPGDVVVSVDGEAVTSPDQLIAQIRARQPGDEVTLGVLSGGSGSEQDVTVTLGEQGAATATEEASEAEED
ncbi:trypsin-like peptidase domain-containing protein [Nocardiopsis ganjiahuensis]|uniref:trypsin-like peptidase domain-containing protein n=1 Tax=Nocardiopsis ganjiahuensis TaxID=239984 RepID=UPI000346A1DC|nr:trypsin-like peptidase domain-containing protein [Nocardiopsis ganjiahuensis]